MESSITSHTWEGGRKTTAHWLVSCSTTISSIHLVNELLILKVLKHDCKSDDTS